MDLLVLPENCLYTRICIISLCDKVCQWLAADRWFSPGTPVSSTNKTDSHDIAEILLKVALNTTNQPINWDADDLKVTALSSALVYSAI